MQGSDDRYRKEVRQCITLALRSKTTEAHICRKSTRSRWLAKQNRKLAKNAQMEIRDRP